jgi:hypothetical protein
VRRMWFKLCIFLSILRDIIVRPMELRETKLLWHICSCSNNGLDVWLCLCVLVDALFLQIVVDGKKIIIFNFFFLISRTYLYRVALWSGFKFWSLHFVCKSFLMICHFIGLKKAYTFFNIIKIATISGWNILSIFRYDSGYIWGNTSLTYEKRFLK